MTMAKWLDLVLLVIMLIFGMGVLNIVITMCSEPIAVAEEDKTVMVSEEGAYIDIDLGTGRTVLMELVVVDELAPYPKAIRINDAPVIRFTDEWLVGKSRNIVDIYKAGGQWSLVSMLDWKIESIEFVYDTDGDYLQYTLVP